MASIAYILLKLKKVIEEIPIVRNITLNNALVLFTSIPSETSILS